MPSVFDCLGCGRRWGDFEDSFSVTFLHAFEEEHGYLCLPRGFEEEFEASCFSDGILELRLSMTQLD